MKKSFGISAENVQVLLESVWTKLRIISKNVKKQL